MYFDARAAKLLKPGETMVVQDCPGLRLEARASRKTWIYRYRTADRSTKQTRIGLWPNVSFADAVIKWQELRDGKVVGIDPKAAIQAERAPEPEPPKVLTVRDVVAEHIKRLKKEYTPGAAQAAERSMLRLLDDSPDLADKEAEKVTRADAYQAIAARKGTPTAADKLRGYMAAAWADALDTGELKEAPNWWREVLRGKLQSKGKIIAGQHVGRQRTVLTQKDLTVLLPWAKDNMHAVGYDVLQLYLRTGTRGKEICSMQPEEVRQEDGVWWWTIPKSKTKNAAVADAVDLRVPLFGLALEIVQRRINAAKGGGVLFPNEKGAPYTQHAFSTYIYNLQPYSSKTKQRQGDGLVMPVSGWSPHNLRRTARTLLAGMGCVNEIGEAVLGHVPEGIVGTYNAYTYDAERVEWLQRLGALIDQLSSGLPARP